MSFSNHLNAAPDEVISEINMTPLVDVMLVLLIIFIVTVPVMTHSVRLDLPRASVQENIVKPETITLSIDRDSTVHWNGFALDPLDLQRRLETAAKLERHPIQYAGLIRVWTGRWPDHARASWCTSHR